MASSQPMPTSTSASEAEATSRIDRLSPTLRPARRAVMRQRWRKLLFVHWQVDPAGLRPLIPDGLELDLFEGAAYVGLVAFTMEGVRPVFLPAVPGLSNFHETNIRTYVHHAGREPGVWFFSLDAANSIAVRLARAWFHLPYHRSLLFLEHEDPRPAGDRERIAYAGVRRWPGPVPASYVIRAEIDGPIEPARPGTLEHFLAERYILYARHRDRLFLGRVHHRSYPLRTGRILAIDETLVAAAGIVRPHDPPLVHFAASVDVEVFPLEPVRIARP